MASTENGDRSLNSMEQHLQLGADGKKRRRLSEDRHQTGDAATVVQTDAESPEITYQVYTNDGENESLQALIDLKNIFSKQLPKMPKDYIVRLVFDRRHRSLAIKRHGRIIGGICYRPYYEQKFAEIAFCAISSKEQVKGYGTKLMNHLKDHMQLEGIEYFLTYADNYAIGYFEKSGFSKTISMPRIQWVGYIKDYDGGTLMEGYIHPSMDYLDVPSVLAKQRQHVIDRCKERTRSNIVYAPLKCFANKQRIRNVLDVPGVREAGWDSQSLGITTIRDQTKEIVQMQAQLLDIWRKIDAHDTQRIFAEPVTADIAPDYAQVISNPIDMSTIRERIMSTDYYRTKEMMRADISLMLQNCKTYNEGTFYADVAAEMERYIKDQKFFVDSDENTASKKEDAVASRPSCEKTVSSSQSHDRKRKVEEMCTQTVSHVQLPSLQIPTDKEGDKMVPMAVAVSPRQLPL